MKKILFVSGTRADYGKIKTLILNLQKNPSYYCHVFVTGMHLIKKYGYTVNEMEKDGITNLYKFENQQEETEMSLALSNTISGLNAFLSDNAIDLLVVHGDRLEALAGSIVGAFRNIRVAHIEGGEVSGTIDESIRHAITKFAHIHFVCNEEARKRILQLGESKDSIFIIGSPDIDIMKSKDLPKLSVVKDYYDITYNSFAIFMYHPVTTEVNALENNVKNVVDALIESNESYIVIYPNNDEGSNLIFKEYKRLENNPRFKLFPSIKFEYFLVLLRECDFIIGNSSAGVREAGIYGVPCIDIGIRQQGRYDTKKAVNIISCKEDNEQILNSIQRVDEHRVVVGQYFGHGDSSDRFMEVLNDGLIWRLEYQKIFNDLDY